MMEQLQPYIETIVTALAGLLVTALLGILALLKGKVETWLSMRTTAQQREILSRLAGEAMAYAEAAFKEAGGDQKLRAAYTYVLKHISDLGIDINGDSVRAAIEKAVLDYNQQKGAGTNDKS